MPTNDSAMMFFQGHVKNFPAWAASAATRLMRFYRENPAEFYFAGVFWSFWTTLAFFPVGYGWREVMPPVCLVFLLLYYRYAWSQSVLARLKIFPLFYCFWAMLLIGVVLSGHPLDSLLHAGTGINKGFILPFIAMECAREEKDLRRLVWACVFACFWQGVDGLWQAHNGRDFIMGYPLNGGRLTGSIGDYAVGNYIALALIPSFSLWFILREKFGRAVSALLWLAVLWPAFFLLLGAAARSGMLAVAASLGLWVILKSGFVRWRDCVRPLAACFALLALFFVLSPRREILLPASLVGEGRWSLWELAWRVFCEHPWFGAGAGQYNTAFRALGLAPSQDAITISHPHNLYLDMLYAHGIVGFVLGMMFLLVFLYWGYRHIRPNFLVEWGRNAGSLYWRFAAAFWIAYAGWLVNGVFGHDFYRTWWLGMAMSYLGIMAGAVVNGTTQSEMEERAVQ
ncbi:MAG: O-antigen ligase family protein [Desulfovibrio sp.]|jgi:O-antigen ligase|nr:O-antigen ligase family protein [Desulfovibrio sp.]